MNTVILKGKRFPERTVLKTEIETGISLFGVRFFADDAVVQTQIAKRDDDARNDESRYMRRVAAWNELRGYTHHIFLDTNVLLEEASASVLDRLLDCGFTLVVSKVTESELFGHRNNEELCHLANSALKRIAEGTILVVGKGDNQLLTGSWGKKVYGLFTNDDGIVQTSKAIKSFLRDRKIEIDALEYIAAEDSVVPKMIFVSDDKDITDFIENAMAKCHREEDYKKLTFVGLEKLLARIVDLRSSI